VRIEDYALIGNMQSAALVGLDGSIDWLCLPRFDSPSCLSAILGDAEHGRFRLAPDAGVVATSRRYRRDTLVLETDFETADGVLRVIDFMPWHGGARAQLMRIATCVSGRVPLSFELALRPDYAGISPWVERSADGVRAVACGDSFRLVTTLDLRIEGATVRGEEVLNEGSSARFSLGWHASHEPTPAAEDVEAALARTEARWRGWSDRCTYDGPYRADVMTSLRVLKAMTSETTGGIVAAPTTSLPEDIGGVRNWDYRYCWLRDSVLALEALLGGGYTEEALAFRDFLLRVGTGDPAKIQIMYGIGGERRLT